MGRNGLDVATRAGVFPRSPRASQAHDDAGVQKPHGSPRATKAEAHRAHRGQPLERRDLATGDAAHRRDASDNGSTVDPRCNTHRPWGSASFTDDTELLPEHVENEMPSATDRAPLRTKTSPPSPAAERAGAAQGAEQRTVAAQLKEEPQPQVRVALGLVMWNPALQAVAVVERRAVRSSRCGSTTTLTVPNSRTTSSAITSESKNIS